MNPIAALLRKEFLLEWRHKHTFFGTLLYAGCTVFVLFLMNGRPEAKVYNALFWITQLFVAVNSIARSFLQEPQSRFRYYFTIVKPSNFLWAKFIYNACLQVFTALLCLFLFLLLLGNPIHRLFIYTAITLMGSISLSMVFTFLAAIASRANQNASIMAVLGFPLIAPMLLMLNRLSFIALSPVYQNGVGMLMLMLLLLSVLVGAIGIILFPFLWRE